MPVQKYINRLERLHLLIRRKATGTVDELANKLALSRRQTLEYISEMRDMGAPIEFCTNRKTYYYTKEVRFTIGFTELPVSEMAALHGGSAVLTSVIYLNTTAFGQSLNFA